MKNLIFTSFLVAFLLTGCSLFKPMSPQISENSQVSQKTQGQNFSDFNKSQSSAQDLILNTKDKFLLSKYVGTKTGRDCSSFVSAVNKDYSNLYYTEKDVAKFYDKSGRKSKAIYNLYASKNLISFDTPNAGDLIFFANTLGKGKQKNKDKKNITHVGIVTQIFDDATIEFVHYTKGKIYRDYMNLTYKNTQKQGKRNINSFVVSCKSSNVSCLASNRFAGYGKVKQEKMPKNRD